MIQFATVRIMFSVVFAGWVSAMAAQAATKPSLPELHRILAATAQDTHRVKALLDVGAHHLFKPLELMSDLDSALAYLLPAQALSDKLANDAWRKECLWHIAYCYFERKEPEKAMVVAEQLAASYLQTDGKLAEADTWSKLASLILRHKDNLDAAILCNEKARAIYEALGEKKRAIDMYKEIADMHLNQGNLELSETELLEIIDLYKGIDYPNLHYTYDLLAAVSTNRGNLNRALLYAFETIKSMEATQDTVADHTFYYRLGNIYWQLDNMKEAVAWYLKSIQNLPNKRYSVRASVVRGMIRMGQTREAKLFLDECMERNPPMNETDSAFIALGYGLCYNAMGEYNKADRSFRDMLRLHGLYNNATRVTSIIHFEYGKFLVERERFAEARPYLDTVLQLPAGIPDIQHQRDAHALLVRVDSAQGQYLDALYHFRQFLSLNDSLFTIEKSRQVEELQIQYETENRERDILFLQNEAQLQSSRLSQARLMKNLLIAGAAILAIFLALLFGRFRFKQRANRMLEIQQLEINQTNQRLKQLLDEKELLLREIHHRVKNNLQIVMSLLNTQSNFLENTPAQEAIQQSQHRIHSISLIHQKLYQSNSYARIEMSGYIHELIEFLKDSFGVEQRVTFLTSLDTVYLDVTQAVPMGLILNEAISNALKYAFPDGRHGVIEIDLHHLIDDQYTLIIADNGVGLPDGFDTLQSKTLGMSLMKGLSKQLNGSLQMENQDGLSIRLVFTSDLQRRQDEIMQDKIISA